MTRPRETDTKNPGPCLNCGKPKLFLEEEETRRDVTPFEYRGWFGGNPTRGHVVAVTTTRSVYRCRGCNASNVVAYDNALATKDEAARPCKKRRRT